MATLTEKKQLNERKHSNRVILVSALVLIFMAQLNINLFINDFKISMAIVFLPLMVFLIEELSPLPVVLISAPGIFVMRCIIQWLDLGTVVGVAVKFAPEMVFHLLYGLLFSLLVRRVNFRNFRAGYFFPLAAIDLLSNIGEMLVRLGVEGLHWQVISPLLVVALGRSLIAMGLIGAFDSYGLLLLRRDDRERYKKLLLLISRLKSEMVWMNKNTSYIENTMSTSYSLYNDLKKEGQEEAAQKALTVAKDIHEIKKEYFLILKGVSEALNTEMEEAGMYFKNILHILQESMEKSQDCEENKIEVLVSCSNNFFTDKHYELMSVFRNLLNNAIEAAPKDRPAQVKLTQWEEGEQMVFCVHDNCGGIPEAYQKNVFQPGFSTKISYETGEINRGLGLVLVHDIVEEMGGTIEMQSSNGCTDFTVKIPKNNLEVA